MRQFRVDGGGRLGSAREARFMSLTKHGTNESIHPWCGDPRQNVVVGCLRTEHHRIERRPTNGHGCPQPRTPGYGRPWREPSGPSSVHRYYDPVTEQFLSVDAAVDTTDQPYSFTGGDPVNGSDPSGLCWPRWACPIENAAVTVARNLASSSATVLGYVQLGADAGAVGSAFIPGVDLFAPEVFLGVSEASGGAATLATCSAGALGDNSSTNVCQAAWQVEQGSGGLLSGPAAKNGGHLIDSLTQTLSDAWQWIVGQQAVHTAVLTAAYRTERTGGICE